MSPEDVLLKNYSHISFPTKFNSKVNAVCAFGDKLGEIIMMSRIPTKAKLEGKPVWTFVNPENKFKFVFDKYVQNHVEPPSEAVRSAFQCVVENNNCGNGNILQQIYRFLGLEVDALPKGLIQTKNSLKRYNKVGIHIDGVGAGTIVGFPTARTIYPQNVDLLEKFILENQIGYDFVQFGLSKRRLEGTTDFSGKSLEETFEELSSCEYLICLNSGFMHLAAALDVKIICVINCPVIQRCYFPVLVNDLPLCVPPLYDANWLYPQAVHLHQDGENELVPRFSIDNLKKAIYGEVYPYWSDQFLYLVKSFGNNKILV